MVPILDIPFLAMLLQAYPVMVEEKVLDKRDFAQNVFSLNISLLDLPNCTDPEITNGYEKCLTLFFKRPEDFEFNAVLRFLMVNPTFSAFGFH